MIKISAVLLLLAQLPFYFGCSNKNKDSSSGQNEIQAFLQSAKKANFCSSESDCALILGRCPLPCHILVNRGEKVKITDHMNSLFLQCLQECGPPGKLVCENGHCVMEGESQ